MWRRTSFVSGFKFATASMAFVVLAIIAIVLIGISVCGYIFSVYIIYLRKRIASFRDGTSQKRTIKK